MSARYRGPPLVSVNRKPIPVFSPNVSATSPKPSSSVVLPPAPVVSSSAPTQVQLPQMTAPTVLSPLKPRRQTAVLSPQGGALEAARAQVSTIRKGISSQGNAEDLTEIYQYENDLSKMLESGSGNTAFEKYYNDISDIEEDSESDSESNSESSSDAESSSDSGSEGSSEWGSEGSSESGPSFILPGALEMLPNPSGTLPTSQSLAENRASRFPVVLLSTSSYNLPVSTLPTSSLPRSLPQVQGSQIQGTQISAPQMSAPQILAPQILAPRVAAPQILAPQISVPRVTASQISSPQISAPRVAAPQISAPRVAAPQISAPQISASQPVIAPQIRPQQIFQGTVPQTSSNLHVSTSRAPQLPTSTSSSSNYVPSVPVFRPVSSVNTAPISNPSSNVIMPQKSISTLGVIAPSVVSGSVNLPTSSTVKFSSGLPSTSPTFNLPTSARSTNSTSTSQMAPLPTSQVSQVSQVMPTPVPPISNATVVPRSILTSPNKTRSPPKTVTFALPENTPTITLPQVTGLPSVTGLPRAPIVTTPASSVNTSSVNTSSVNAPMVLPALRPFKLDTPTAGLTIAPPAPTVPTMLPTSPQRQILDGTNGVPKIPLQVPPLVPSPRLIRTGEYNYR